MWWVRLRTAVLQKGPRPPRAKRLVVRGRTPLMWRVSDELQGRRRRVRSGLGLEVGRAPGQGGIMQGPSVVEQ